MGLGEHGDTDLTDSCSGVDIKSPSPDSGVTHFLIFKCIGANLR